MIRILSIMLIFISSQSWADEIDYESIKEKGIYLKCDGYKEDIFYGKDRDFEKIFKKHSGCSSDSCRKPLIKFLIYMPEQAKPMLNSDTLFPLGFGDGKWTIENNLISYLYQSKNNNEREEILLNLITGEYKYEFDMGSIEQIERISAICEQIPNKLKFSTSKLFGLIQ